MDLSAQALWQALRQLARLRQVVPRADAKLLGDAHVDHEVVYRVHLLAVQQLVRVTRRDERADGADKGGPQHHGIHRRNDVHKVLAPGSRPAAAGGGA
eukprot:3647789-Prymnesium_polylepis.1